MMYSDMEISDDDDGLCGRWQGKGLLVWNEFGVRGRLKILSEAVHSASFL